MSGETIWTTTITPAPDEPHLGSDEIHVWRLSLAQPPAVVSAFALLLSPDELSRAARYHFSKDRDHFIVARAVLRILLGRYLRAEPSQLRFCYNPYGRPALAAATEVASGTLSFNLSHSRELALYALARNREIGIDLEYIRDDFATEEIAKRFFSPGEVAALGALPLNQRTAGFFRCWTRKEAYIKAKGQGLSLPLDQFDVSLAPDEPAALLRIEGSPEEASRWSMRELTPGQNYAAVVVVEGHDWQLNCFQWPEKIQDAQTLSSFQIPTVEESLLL